MYRKPDGQMTIADFILPFEGKLKADNRWVKMAAIIPWDEIEEEYAKLFENEIGNVAKHEKKVHSVGDRIVSITQSHIRAIVRGKAIAPTEFGAKLSISLIDAHVFLDKLEWDNYNEGLTLIDFVKRYHERTGYYPASVHADVIYRNRENLNFCKDHGIRLSGPKLG